MSRFFLYLSGSLLLGVMLSSVFFEPSRKSTRSWDAKTPVSEVLAFLGSPDFVAERPEEITSEKIAQGKTLITQGRLSTANGKSAKLQSRYYVCTDCHNIQKEDPDLRFSDPEKRLNYVNKKGIPFLQGTTLYGTVNKSSWYNGDYVKKYGDLVKPANKSLKAAIQLCATVCSQGRALEIGEMDAVLAYLWSLELKLGDLALSPEDWQRLWAAEKKQEKDTALASWLKGFYLSYSPATFEELPESFDEGYPISSPNPENGALIYELSCMSCHSTDGPSNYLKLGKDPLSLGMLARHISRNSRFSIYQLTRKGTYSVNGHRAYMPHYPLERMSNQQVEDLRAFLEQH